MSSFRRASTDAVNAFPVGETYLFKHYFEGEEVFDHLRGYYDHSQYRFEVPESEFDDVESFLSMHGYALVVVEEPGEFVVVKRKYTDHPEGIFKDSVLQRSAGGYNCFLMTDLEAVERAVDRGATRLRDADLDATFRELVG